MHQVWHSGRSLERRQLSSSMGRSPSYDENGLKKGPWTPEEDHKWSSIASHLPGRTDNEIKNFWNTHLKKKLIQMGFDPMTHRPRTDFFATLQQLIAVAKLRELIDGRPWDDHAARLQAEAAQVAKLQYFHHLQQLATAMETPSVPSPAPYRDIDGQRRDDDPLPELQVPCFFFDQPIIISNETKRSSNPIGLSLGDTSPGSPFIPPLPPLADVSIGNLQGDARSGNPPPSWPEILFDDPFLLLFGNTTWRSWLRWLPILLAPVDEEPPPVPVGLQSNPFGLRQEGDDEGRHDGNPGGIVGESAVLEAAQHGEEGLCLEEGDAEVGCPADRISTGKTSVGMIQFRGKTMRSRRRRRTATSASGPPPRSP
ncbi:hypothetical protein B296_00000539 [Ensete ventricosum]|uniref:Uncharacterized protein n=1 Tax=Ensete ventricosum TaxID=4639 RepID=A0A427AH86_ENSVE|nr:hypothetical protein B296_00000539 [Ensete ventricosum]